MVNVNKNLEITKNNLSDLDDVIVASENPNEGMRRDLLKIANHFHIHIYLEKRTEHYTMK